MAAIPVEILLGLYLGLLTGIIPALVSGVLGFVFKYFTGVTLPGFGVVVLAVAIAGVNGGLLGLVDPSISSSPRIMSAVLVVMMLSLYAHSQGDKLGASLPKRFSLRRLRRRTLSADVVDFVGGIGEVTVRPAGSVADLEGYPPLPTDLRTQIEGATWRLPADLPLSELEHRLVERLKTEFDVADASVSLDGRGKATIAAAPPSSGLSRRIPTGHRAVSVDALVPTGLARGERVRVTTTAGTVEGTLVSARSDPSKDPPPAPVVAPDDDGDEPGGDVRTDGGTEDGGEAAPVATPTTDGGEGRVTVAVPRREADVLLKADRGTVVVRSRGTHREYKLLSHLRRSGRRIRRLELAADSPLAGETLAGAGIRTEHGVAVLAVRHGDGSSRGRRGRRQGGGDGTRGWSFSPTGDTRLAGGDEVFVVGTHGALDAFAEVAT
jgi:hypothetical protein